MELPGEALKKVLHWPYDPMSPIVFIDEVYFIVMWLVSEDANNVFGKSTQVVLGRKLVEKIFVQESCNVVVTRTWFEWLKHNC